MCSSPQPAEACCCVCVQRERSAIQKWELWAEATCSYLFPPQFFVLPISAAFASLCWPPNLPPRPTSQGCTLLFIHHLFIAIILAIESSRSTPASQDAAAHTEPATLHSAPLPGIRKASRQHLKVGAFPRVARHLCSCIVLFWFSKFKCSSRGSYLAVSPPLVYCVAAAAKIPLPLPSSFPSTFAVQFTRILHVHSEKARIPQAPAGKATTALTVGTLVFLHTQPHAFQKPAVGPTSR